ncbi:hypothetical protein ACJ41O_002471 [Fusarium nematophilum]
MASVACGTYHGMEGSLPYLGPPLGARFNPDPKQEQSFLSYQSHDPSLTSTTNDSSSSSLRPQNGDSYPQPQPCCIGLTNLPYPIFLDIFSLLSPVDVARCRRVSQDLHRALTGQALCASLVLQHFPRAREARILRGWIAGDETPEGEGDDLESTDWAVVFARLTRRYWHLGRARPRTVDKVSTAKGLEAFHGVRPWDRFLRSDGDTARFHHSEPLWAFSPADGLLIYPDPESTLQGGPPRFLARDLETEEHCLVPFQLSTGSILRVHVNHHVLLFTLLLPSENGKCVFIEAFDVVRHRPATLLPRRNPVSYNKPERPWTFRSRGRFPLRGINQPFSPHDRVFCAHNSTHAALYTWITTTTTTTTNEPEPELDSHPTVEQLSVWNIDASPDGPVLEHSFANDDLGRLGLCQKHTPRLRNLELDSVTRDPQTRSLCGHVYVLEDDHPSLAGPQSSDRPPIGYQVRTVGIPLSGNGPIWQHGCDGRLPTFGRLSPFSRRTLVRIGQDAAPPCASSSRPGDAAATHRQCWRHDMWPFITVSQAHDAAAGVRIRASQLFKQRSVTVTIQPDQRVQGWATAAPGQGQSRWKSAIFQENIRDELMAKGHICGDERWVVGEDLEGDITILRF